MPLEDGMEKGRGYDDMIGYTVISISQHLM